MLFENEAFDGGNPGPPRDDWRDAVFRYCTFDGIDIEGLSIDGILQGCTFTACKFYWGLFNTTLLASVRFLDCTFPGTSFRGVKFIDCEFERCQFVLDNLGGDCTIDDCVIAATTLTNCSWMSKPSRGKPDITDNIWLGCTQTRCRGFEKVF